jgi:hypothetical protein
MSLSSEESERFLFTGDSGGQIKTWDIHTCMKLEHGKVKGKQKTKTYKIHLLFRIV